MAQDLAFQTMAGTTGVATPFSNSSPVTFNNPYGIAVDSSGNVYVADTSNHVVRRISPAAVVTTLAGVAGGLGSTDDSTANAPLARFNSPQGIALNPAGDRVFVADAGNHTIRVIALTGAGGTVVSVGTLAGSAGTSGTTTDTTGLNARFTTPRGIAADTAGNLYVSDTGNHLIRKIVIATTAVSTVAGLPGTPGAVNGNSTVATFNNPYGIAVSSDNNTLYVADFNNHAVRAIALAPAVTVSTLAGTAGTAGFIDGAAAAAGFRLPTGVAVDGAGNVLVVDFGNNALRQIAGGLVSTPAGPVATGNTSLGAQGMANGTGNTVRFTAPTSIATKTVGGVAYVYIADTGNHLIRQGATPASPAVTNPAPVSTNVGATGVTFSATVTGGWPTPVLQWQIKPGGSGSWQNLMASTTYQNVNSATLTINGVTASMSGDQFRLMTTPAPVVEPTGATLTISQAPSFASGAVSFTGVVGRTSTFIVAAAGSPTITYSPVGAIGTTGFSLNANGTITGTPTTTDFAVFTVTATNASGSASQVVTLTNVPEANAAAPTITSSPSATFATGQTNNFTFTASGQPTPIIGLSGTLPAGVTFLNGLLSGRPFSADNSPFTLTVTATNALGSISQTFTLAVTAATIAPTIVTHPVNVVANLGQNTSLSGSATGSPTPALRWQRQASGSTGGFADLFNDGVYSGTDTGTLLITNVQAGMTGDQFRLVATNATGSATTSVATLTVNVGTTISLFAGQPGVSGAADGLSTAARFNNPASITVDSAGNFYVADTANHVIRKISSAGLVTTLAGSPGLTGSADGTGSDARFSGPSAVAVNSVGTVFVADTFNQTIRSITPNGVVTTLAGSAGAGGSADGNVSSARFSFPSGIAVDTAGNIYVADSSNHTIRRIQSATVTTFAGSAGLAGTADGVGASARFTYPGNMVVDSAGVLYVADSLNHTIRRVGVTGTVTTLAGNPGVPGALDAHGSAANFNRPSGVAVDSSGNVYVADTNNHTIRRVTSIGTVTTIAGSPGQSGASDGAGTEARFNQPFGIAIDVNGNLFIADTRNHVIRRSGTTVAPSIITPPQNTVVPVGATATFSVVAAGSPAPSYQWQRQAVDSSGFVNLSNGSGYSGVNSATLSVTNLFNSNSGDQYRVLVSNGVNPSILSEPVTLTIGEPPVFTSPASATVRASDPISFTFTAGGSPVASFSATSLPTWAALSPTGVLTGTPPVGAEGTYSFTVTANNGAMATQAFTLTVTPAVTLPTVTTQPGSLAVNQGQSATFTVAATGTAPLTYQWRRNGAAIAGATGSSYTIANAQVGSSGVYSVQVSNAAGSVASANAELVVNGVPAFTIAPQSQVALPGSTVMFNVAVTGGSSFSYQWRKNGVPIAGANSATLTLTGVTSSDAGNYDVQVSNAFALAISSLATLDIVSVPSAPVITAQPANRVVLAGGSITLNVGASAAPSPSFLWRKNGVPIVGASNATLSISNAGVADAGNYDVVVTNSAGAVVSAAGNLRVISRSFAGTYFGTFSGGFGGFALHVRDDNSAVFLGYVPSSSAPILSLNLIVNDNGTFSFSQTAVAITTSAGDTPARAAALAPVAVSGTIANDGTISGTVSGGANASLAASRAPDAGATQSSAGFYQAGATTNAAVVYTIVGANGQSFVVIQSGSSSDGGAGTVSSSGQVAMSTGRSVTVQTIAAGGIISGTATGVVSATLTGGNDVLLARQRLLNISSRTRVGTGDSVAIAGFVISGEQSKPVLIRAVGPTLGAAPFSVPGVLASPRLELFRGSTSLAVNSGIGTNRAAIDAAGVHAGAFALGAAGTDAAILTTLAPGAYTAIVSSSTNTAGVALIEVYDLSGATPGQKLLNISTRAAAGTNENTLIAGFVVPPGTAKRVLVRGVGPGLAAFGVTGTLAQPALTLLNGSTPVAQNTNWSTSNDAAAITAASAQVGGFGLANNDSALIATLAPGNYTAQVVGVNNATGVALIEVYELP